jgi:hypothetical protein
MKSGKSKKLPVMWCGICGVVYVFAVNVVKMSASKSGSRAMSLLLRESKHCFLPHGKHSLVCL